MISTTDIERARDRIEGRVRRTPVLSLPEGALASWWPWAAVPSSAVSLLGMRPVDIQTGGLAADSLGCRRVGTIGFNLAQRFVEQALGVPEEAIRQARRLLWEDLRILAEPGGAVALAALLDGSYAPVRGERVGVIVCGGNTDPASLGA